MRSLKNVLSSEVKQKLVNREPDEIESLARREVAMVETLASLESGPRGRRGA